MIGKQFAVLAYFICLFHTVLYKLALYNLKYQTYISLFTNTNFEAFSLMVSQKRINKHGTFKDTLYKSSLDM